ncbi:hypothetical protein E3Q19_00527 [Wallemia mellicola]|nr:hypothetical protein E3Q19_00527 [Wallemia mellicola]TIC33180.1 hypothetical protein E3Q11_00215 [Wallemia mellicola]
MTSHRRRQSSIDFHSALTAAAECNHIANLSPIIEKFPNAVTATPSRKILFGFDGRKESEYTLNYIKSKLLRSGDQLFLANVLPMPDEDDETHEAKLLELKAHRDQVHHDLRQISEELINSGLHITTTVVVLNHANAKIAICRIADHHAVDLIVVGGHVRRSDTQTPGTCASYILKQARTPVMIVKSKS